VGEIVAFSTEHIGEELLESITRPCRNLDDLLGAMMTALAERLPVDAASLFIEDLGTLIVRRTEGRVAVEWLPSDFGPLFGGGSARIDPRAEALVLPVRYAETAMGELRVELSARLRDSVDPQLLKQFAHQCALLVKRYYVRGWAEQRLGRPLLLVGMSRGLRELERFVEISARRLLPVLLRGEFGTEKGQLAASIHCCSAVGDGPFVEIDCAHPESEPDDWLERAQGGTLYLSDVDELDAELQRRLPHFLPLGPPPPLPRPGGRPIRLIASTTADLHERARQGQFSRRLLAGIDFLSVELPPLRERSGDIDALVHETLERYGYPADEKASEALLALCRVHDWPENLSEMERLITRLAVMTEDRPIQLSDIRRHAPDMLANGARIAAAIPAARPRPPGESAGVAEWVRCALEGGGTRLCGIHDGLRRAILHLGRHYDEPVSLTELASRAGVSASHLGYLFREAVGLSFKALLGRIRVAKACELLETERRRSVTDIALTVGFADLTHFERHFRRFVGQSPREFRRTLAPYGAAEQELS
jgi:AraC-like DNA-binding protein